MIQYTVNVVQTLSCTNGKDIGTRRWKVVKNEPVDIAVERQLWSRPTKNPELRSAVSHRLKVEVTATRTKSSVCGA